MWKIFEQKKVAIAPVLKLADLAQMYKTHLEQLGVEIDGRVHTSRLKLRLLSVVATKSQSNNTW